MPACIIFEIESNYLEQFKTAMSRKGYHSSWKSNGISYDLPNSMMWSPEAALDKAMDDVNNSIAELNSNPYTPIIKIEKLIVLPSNPWRGLPRKSVV